jgi:hypothetical protein
MFLERAEKAAQAIRRKGHVRLDRFQASLSISEMSQILKGPSNTLSHEYECLGDHSHCCVISDADIYRLQSYLQGLDPMKCRVGSF